MGGSEIQLPDQHGFRCDLGASGVRMPVDGAQRAPLPPIELASWHVNVFRLDFELLTAFLARPVSRVFEKH